MPLFKRKRQGEPAAAGAPSGGSSADPMLAAARKLIDANLPGVRFLAQPGAFDRAKMEQFLELMGNPLDGVQRMQLLNANAQIMPRQATDGTWMDGYEIMRWQLFDVTMQGVQAGIKLLGSASSQEAVSYLRGVMAEIEGIQRRATS